MTSRSGGKGGVSWGLDRKGLDGGDLDGGPYDGLGGDESHGERCESCVEGEVEEGRDVRRG